MATKTKPPSPRRSRGKARAGSRPEMPTAAEFRDAVAWLLSLAAFDDGTFGSLSAHARAIGGASIEAICAARFWSRSCRCSVSCSARIRSLPLPSSLWFVVIRSRTPNDCFDQFVTHVGSLVGKMLSNRYPVLCPRPPKRSPQDRRTLSLKNPEHDDAIPLATRDHGRIYFYLAQELSAQPDGAGHRLRTEKYWYKLFAQSPAVCDEPTPNQSACAGRWPSPPPA